MIYPLAGVGSFWSVRLEVFTDGASGSQQQVRIADLERLVGQLTMELELSKKISTLLSSRYSKSGR